MAHESSRRTGCPDHESFSRWGSLSEGWNSITNSHEQQLATPLPPVYPPPPPLTPNLCYKLSHYSTGGACSFVSPTVRQLPEQLTTTASLSECPVAGSVTTPNHMDLETTLPNLMDFDEVVPLNFIESQQDSLFAGSVDLETPFVSHPSEHHPPQSTPSLLQFQSASVTPVGSETPLHDSSSPLSNQCVPEDGSCRRSEQDSSLASDSAPLASNSAPLASDSAHHSSVAPSSFSVIPPGSFIPPSSPQPGDYGFKLHFAECSTNTPWTFSQALNTLFIKPEDDFAVTFKFTTPPPPGCYVRALVCYEDPVHIQKLGVVTVTPHRDKGSKDSEHSDHFLRCKVPQATYGEYYTHKCVTVTVDTLPVSEWGPFCVYSYACYSGRIVGAGKNKPSLRTIFTVIHNGREIGWDMVTVKCRACPSRDLHKELHGRPKRKANPDADPAEGPPRTKRQRRLATDAATSATLPQGNADPPPPPILPPLSPPLPPIFPSLGIHAVDLVGDEQPDDEGYYNFAWRTRDRGLYNMLLMLRTGYQ